MRKTSKPIKIHIEMKISNHHMHLLVISVVEREEKRNAEAKGHI